MISTYDELKAAVARWLNRSDLTDTIPDFIALAESYLNRELRLRLAEIEGTLEIAAGARSIALPADFIAPSGVWINDAVERESLRYLAPEQMIVETAAGYPCGWTITGGELQLDRPTDTPLTLTIRYRGAFALSEDQPTNWLLTNHPDAYLFSALTEAAPFLRDTEALSIWTARRNQAVDEINAKEARSTSLATLDTSLPMPGRFWSRGGYGRIG